MTDLMKSILSRVLSEEIGHQEQWKEKDIQRFSKDVANRDKVISEIRSFMDDNNIEFRHDFYLGVF